MFGFTTLNLLYNQPILEKVTLGSLLSGERQMPDATSVRDVTVFKSVGVAIQASASEQGKIKPLRKKEKRAEEEEKKKEEGEEGRKEEIRRTKKEEEEEEERRRRKIHDFAK